MPRLLTFLLALALTPAALAGPPCLGSPGADFGSGFALPSEDGAPYLAGADLVVERPTGYAPAGLTYWVCG